MSPQDLIVRCIARREGDLYVAVCLDFTLAAQGFTMEEACGKLHRQILSYVLDALTIDREHAAELLIRKAPMMDRMRFWLSQQFQHFGLGEKTKIQHKWLAQRKAYHEALPLVLSPT